MVARWSLAPTGAASGAWHISDRRRFSVGRQQRVIPLLSDGRAQRMSGQCSQAIRIKE
jgi:hypothetical protein